MQVKTWEKVNQGMQKMYLGEVLGKLPVMQHFLFGSILPYEGPEPAAPSSLEEEHDGHTHLHGKHIHPKVAASLAAVPRPSEGDLGGAGQQEVGWGDCCGIPVPSAFGAAKADAVSGGLRLSGPNIKPVPFD
jgi:serine/threonine-protein phosphatase 2A activator